MGAGQDGVAGYIAAWAPVAGPPQAAEFARQVVRQAAPGNTGRAKNLLWAASKLAEYGVGLGLEAEPGVLLHPSVIERFAAHAPGLSGPARRTHRTNLRFLGRKVVPHLHPADAPLPRERAKAPYSPAEIDGFLALAAAQPTTARAMRAAALICLGAGAGLIRADLRQARGTDVVTRPGGLVVVVRGRRPRVVPVLARYHDGLLEAAAFAGDQFLAGGGGLPALDTSRLRATWLAECAALIGLPAFLQAAGISCCQRLGDITATLDAGGEEQAIALLGGSSR